MEINYSSWRVAGAVVLLGGRFASMDDIVSHVRQGLSMNVRLWLDNTENDLNQGDDHRFSLLHWACWDGHLGIVDLLLQRGARLNATNMGDDTPLHLAASHGHREVVRRLVAARAPLNPANEHGNTPLHYACFWNHAEIAEDLVNQGALVNSENRYGQTALDVAKPRLARFLRDRARQLGQVNELAGRFALHLKQLRAIHTVMRVAGMWKCVKFIGTHPI